jgi:hypothetical protein
MATFIVNLLILSSLLVNNFNYASNHSIFPLKPMWLKEDLVKSYVRDLEEY